MVSPLVLGAVPVLVSVPVWGGASEQDGTGAALRAVGFYRGGGAILVVYGGGTLHLGLAGAGWLWGQI